MREGALRRGGTPTSSTDQRRNRFKNRHRVTTNKQRIDPQKWADLLAKIRQKTVATNESEPVDEAKPTAEAVEGGQDGDTGINEGLEDTERGRSEGAGEEAETEGSSLDETDLQEEGLQQIYPVNKEMLTPTDTNTDIETGTEIKTDTETGTEIKTDTETGTEIKTDTETGTEIKTDTETGTEIKTDTETGTEIKTDTETGTEIKTDTDTDTEIKTATESTETQTNIENETESETEKATPQTESVTNTETQKEAVTLKPMSAANEIVPEPGEGDEPEANTNPSRTKPQNPRGGLFPNLVPNSRPQSPWNSRRRIGQRRRIINRPRGHPLTPRRPIPEPTNPRSQTETPVTTTDQINMLMLVSTTTSPVMLLTRDHIETTSNDVVLNSQSSTISNTVGISTSATPSLTPSSSSITSLSPSHTKIHIDMVTHPANIPDTAKSTLFNTLTPAPTHSDATVVQTHSPNTHAETYTHGIQTHTKTHTSLGKHVDEPSSDPNVVLERNLSSEPYVSHSSISLSPTPSSIVSSTVSSTVPKRGQALSTLIPEGGLILGVQTRIDPLLTGGTLELILFQIQTAAGLNGPPPLHSRLPLGPRIADPHIRTVSVPAESTARLACEAQGEPKPSITWTKVSTGAVMSILSKAERFEVLPNGTLVIQNIQLQDRGTYICSAQSFLGRDRLLANLEVWTRPPRMQLASYREVTIHQGGEVHLQCQADGVPSPLLSWVLPDRSVLTSSTASTSRIIMDTNGTLHIPVTLTGDRGVYRCVASNSAGAVSASARVHVSSLPPVIQQAKEEHLLLSPGRPVYAHCSARGAPTPTLRWRIPDGTIVRQSQFLHGNIFVLPNGTLHIRGVRPKDSGNYECIASNAVGADKRTVRVEIEGSAEGERSQSEARHEGAKAVEKTSSSLNKDRTLSIPSHPSNPFNSARLPASSPHDRSGTLPLNPSSSRSSFYPRPPTLTNSLLKINKTVTPYPTHLSNINKTKLSPLSPSSTMPTNNTKVSPGIVNNTKVISPPPSKKYTASAALHPLPVSPFSKALIVSTSPSSSTVHYGLFLQLHCSVTGNPAPIIIWRTPIRKLVDVHYSFDHRLKVHPNGTLSIRALTEKDAGDYLCIARNKVSDDYRRLRVSVVTKPAKIAPKQPLNQMVSFGTPLKVDCQASGLPDPSVRWSLPDGTMVNSVLQGEDRGGRTRRPTVFDNGTLLVPAVGMGEEGEYTCYAENQGGQDTMKVKVKIMRTSLPTFTDDRSHHVVKVREGATATIPCQATGVPAPTVTWFSPTRRVIPKSLGSGFYSERVVVVSGGTLEVRLAQKIDTGTYTCRAINSAGERSMLVGLEVEAANHGQSGRVGGRVKQRAVKGQTVVLPCLSQGSPPPRVAWLLPGNGVLPAPYYGSRLTVHRNGSLELRGVRASDSGTLVCVVRSERGQTSIQVELEVSEPQEESRLSHRGRADERPVMEHVGVIEAPRPGASLDSAKSLSSRPVLPEALHPKIQVTQKPLHRGQSLPAAPRPVGPPPRSSSPVSEPAVSTRTAPLVSIVNGENLRLPCPAPQTHGYTQGSLSWTMPNGKVLNRGESDDSGRYKVQEDGILTVQQASVYDRGIFSCISTSGDSVSVITVPVIVIAYPPRITTGPSPVTYTRPGVAVELPCRTIATPRATVTWETPDLTQLRVMGQARIYGNRYLSPQGSLVIQNPTSRDTGFYRCTAKNVIGVDTKATYLHVI
ncbi:hypothetical protein NQZ68_004505 [Dissostichus eleginoides]|nr:hypothetical protein NQZ68_004505 [Dissostichus eleginoides]